MQTPILTVTATCKDNRECIFDNVGIFVDLTLTNSSDDVIGVPVEFLDQLGPFCVLIDNETHDDFPITPGLPDRSLMDKFTPIPPGGSIKIEQLLPAGAIKWFREHMIDLTARFKINIPVKMNGAVPAAPQTAVTTLRIVGRDKAELERRAQSADGKHRSN